jgi:DNA invertase Pin-like site-specific DNA recombinase
VASGAKSERPGLNDALTFVREGDTLVVWKLDRVGRSVDFRSLHENIDTTTGTGKLIFHIFAVGRRQSTR